MIRKDRLIRLMKQLIRIDSQNPPGNESRIADFVARYLAGSGVRSRKVAYKPRRTNIIASLRSSRGAKELLITPHLDTVPAGGSWREDPFGARIRAGRLYGLGATDCKVNLACSLEVIRSLVEDKVKLPYTLTLAATADEESGSGLGLIPLLDKGVLKPDAAVVLDADARDIIVSQKGLIHLKVRITGTRAHGAYPWLGHSAIGDAVRVLTDIRPSAGRVRRSRYLRPPTVNIGTIRGGDKVNVVADWCEFELDFRFLPGESSRALLAELKKTIAKTTKRFTIEVEGIQQPYEIAKGHPLVSGLQRAMRACGVRPVVCGSEGATVITFFQHKRIPAVATGFGVRGCAHKADEYLRISDLYKGACILERFLSDYRF